jgi:hypothetical protein
MEFLNNTRHISGLLIILALTMFACKKGDEHTSFYQDSTFPQIDRSDQSVIQPVLNTLDAFKFTNYGGSQMIMYADSMPWELMWLKAQRSTDFLALNSAPIFDDNRTQVRALYDANGLYISVYCWDLNMTNLPNIPIPANGQDYRGKSDMVSIYLLGPGATSVLIMQATPQSFNSVGIYDITSGTTTIPSTSPNANAVVTCKRNNQQGTSGITGWFAEVRIPFAATSPFGFTYPAADGTTIWKMNVVRQDFNYNGTNNVMQGKYAWKDPLAMAEQDPSGFNYLRFNSKDLTNETFNVNLRGQIISTGPINVEDYGFTGHQVSTNAAFNKSIDISLGKKVNPGTINAVMPALAGDSITYNSYIRNPNGSLSKSYTQQKMMVR